MRLGRKDQVFEMPRLRNLDDSRAIYGTHESRAHTMDTLFSETVFDCVRIQVMTCTDPLAVWHDDKGAGISSFVGKV